MQATISTRADARVEGEFRGATESEVMVEVAGQTISLPLAEVLDISFAGNAAPRVDPPSMLELTMDFSGRGEYDFAIVGEASYQSTLQRVAGDRLRQGEAVTVSAVVIPEPSNPVDSTAIAVFVEGFGKVGHFPAGSTLEWQTVNTLLRICTAGGRCPACLRGGTDARPNIGVWLDLCSAQEATDRMLLSEACAPQIAAAMRSQE